LRVAEFQQPLEARAFGGVGMRIAAVQIALEQQVQFAAAAPAAPSEP